MINLYRSLNRLQLTEIREGKEKSKLKITRGKRKHPVKPLGWRRWGLNRWEKRGDSKRQMVSQRFDLCSQFWRGKGEGERSEKRKGEEGGDLYRPPWMDEALKTWFALNTFSHAPESYTERKALGYFKISLFLYFSYNKKYLFYPFIILFKSLSY